MTLLLCIWMTFSSIHRHADRLYWTCPSSHVQKLLDNQWICKLKKCDFATKSLEYLGHIVSDGRIAIDPNKMKAVSHWPIPFKKFHELQSFLGLVSYYRKFIPYFSHTWHDTFMISHARMLNSNGLTSIRKR